MHLCFLCAELAVSEKNYTVKEWPAFPLLAQAVCSSLRWVPALMGIDLFVKVYLIHWLMLLF